MFENNENHKRWYDEDPVITKCVSMLENLQDSLKHRTATFLMDEIINKEPYSNMVPDEVLQLVNSEDRKRRWYDFDEVMRIFVELLRHVPVDTKKSISIEAITFIEDINSGMYKETESIHLEVPEEGMYLNNHEAQ